MLVKPTLQVSVGTLSLLSLLAPQLTNEAGAQVAIANRPELVMTPADMNRNFGLAR
jgi:hypothetical protein